MRKKNGAEKRELRRLLSWARPTSEARVRLAIKETVGTMCREEIGVYYPYDPRTCCKLTVKRSQQRTSDRNQTRQLENQS